MATVGTLQLLADDDVTLRPPNRNDIALLAEWGKDPEFARFQWATEPWKEPEAFALRFIQQFVSLPPSQGRLLMIAAKSCAGATIGYVNYRAVRPKSRSCAAGIALVQQELWSQGYGARAMRLLLEYLFGTLELHKVAVRVTAFNTPAVRSLETCGFRREGLLRDSYWLEDRWWDCLLMAVLEDEWGALRNGAGAPDGD